jgi:hypothetical protein
MKVIYLTVSASHEFDLAQVLSKTKHGHLLTGVGQYPVMD